MMRTLCVYCRVALLASAVAAACLGCQSAQQAYCRTFSNWSFERTRFTIKSPYGTYKYEHSEDPALRSERIVFGYGSDERTLTDHGADGTIEKVEYRGQTYLREDKGTEEIFSEADEQMAYYKEQMLAAKAYETWITKRADDVARDNGFFKK